MLYCKKDRWTAFRVLAFALTLLLCSGMMVGCAAKMETAEISVEFGSEKQIELQNQSASLTWQSADESVATVNDKGVVKGGIPGLTEITASEGGKTVAKVNVTVVPAALEMTVDFGAEKQIELAKSGSFIWSSEDKDVATVNDKGAVQGIAPGSTVITVKQGDTTIATVSVTVQIVEATAIFLSAERLEMELESTQQLTYMLVPDNASNYGVSWKSANNTIAVIDENGTVTALSDGTTMIICSTANGQMATCEITVKPKSAIEQLNEKEKLLFDYMVKTWLTTFYNASAVRIRNLYWGGGNSSTTISVIADIQGMNRMGGYVYKYYGILLYDGGGLAIEAPSPDLSKPMPTEEMDYSKINAALEEYWHSQGAY